MAEEEAQALTHGIDVRGLRAATVIRYSTSSHPLQAAVVHCLRLVARGTEDDTALLEALHTLPVSTQVGRRRGAGGAQAGSHWMHRWKQSCARGPDLPAELRAAHAAFDDSFVDFVRKVVLPNLADPRGILFQRRPTFRCHLAGGGQPTGRPHCDSEYGHQRGELNFWLPLTRVSGSNSLYSESAPGLADFASFELEYGECQRFWGARCLHFTKANERPPAHPRQLPSTFVSSRARAMSRAQVLAGLALDSTPPWMQRAASSRSGCRSDYVPCYPL